MQHREEVRCRGLREAHEDRGAREGHAAPVRQRVETPQPFGGGEEALLQQLAALEPPSTSSADTSTTSSAVTSCSAAKPRRHPAEQPANDSRPSCATLLEAGRAVLPPSLALPPRLSREGSGASISSSAVAVYGCGTGSIVPLVTTEASLSPLHCVLAGVVPDESGLFGDAESPGRDSQACEPWADENSGMSGTE